MSNPAARAIASIAVCLAAAAIAWASPSSAGLALLGLMVGIYNIWSNA